MRILLMGQAAFGAKVLETLLEKGEHIIGVYTPRPKPGGRNDPLADLAVTRDIPVYQPSTYRDDTVFAEYSALKPDLTVMAFVTDIIPERYFSIPTHGSINYHPSLLPRHRGASAINWAVIMGDTRTGLTIFWPDGGIDTGPILLQKEIDIKPDDTTGSLYFNHLFPMGVDAIVESVSLIKGGKAPRIDQDESAATYEPPCDDAVAKIDWDRPANEIYNLIRGCDPQPGAFVRYRKEALRLYAPLFIKEASDKAAGTILETDDRGIHIAVSGGRLIIGKVKPGLAKKITAKEFVSEQHVESGELLGS